MVVAGAAEADEAAHEDAVAEVEAVRTAGLAPVLANKPRWIKRQLNIKRLSQSSMSKREQAKDLLEILIPQTVEINLQQMLASGQLKKKNVSKKRREMLKQQLRAAKIQTSKGKRKKKKKTKKRKKKSSRYYSTSDSDSDSETSSDTSSDDSSDSDSSESSASSSISTSSSSSDAATSRKRRKRKKYAQRKKKKKEKEKAAADAGEAERAQTDRDAETAGKLLSQEKAMEAKYAAKEACPRCLL